MANQGFNVYGTCIYNYVYPYPLGLLKYTAEVDDWKKEKRKKNRDLRYATLIIND